MAMSLISAVSVTRRMLRLSLRDDKLNSGLTTDHLVCLPDRKVLKRSARESPAQQSVRLCCRLNSCDSKAWSVNESAD